MSIRSMLVAVDGTERSDGVLNTALAIARQLDAHLEALHVKPDAREAVPLLGEGMSGAMIEEMIDLAEREADARAARARAQFDAAVAETGVPTCDAPPGPGGVCVTWRQETGREDETVAWRGRLSDLIVAARPAGDAEAASALVLNAALFESGRPVLVVPPAPVGEVGRTIAIAWNGSAQAARAVAAAMPLLQAAASVRILTISSAATPAAAGEELSKYLHWHGISAETVTSEEIEGAVGADVLGKAGGADLLVMGAYTHSRLRQLILGGVTRYVLENASIPVLMSH